MQRLRPRRPHSNNGIPLAGDLPQNGGITGKLPRADEIIEDENSLRGVGLRPLNPALAISDPTGQIQPIAPDAKPVTYQPAQTVLPKNPALAFQSPIEGAPTKNGQPVPYNPAQVMTQPVQGNIRPKKPMNFSTQQPQNFDDVRQNLSVPEIPSPSVAAPLRPVNPIREASKLEKTNAKIAELQNRKFDDDWGIMDSLKGAGLGFLKAFGATGNLGSGLGGALAGTVQGSIDPNTDEKFITQNKLAQLYGVQTQQQAEEEFKAKQRKADQDAIRAQFEAKGADLSNQSKVLDILRTQNKPLYDSALADDIITEQEAKDLNQAGYPVMPYDARQFETVWVNGKPMTVPKKGVPVASRNPTLADKTLEVPEEVSMTNPDGTISKYKGTPSQILNAAVGVAQANTNRAVQDSQFKARQEENKRDNEYRTQKDYDDAVQRHEKDIRAARAKAAGAKTRLEAAEKNRAELVAGSYDTSEVDKQILSAKSDLAETAELMKVLPPKKVIRPKNPTGASNKAVKPQKDPLRLFD